MKIAYFDCFSGASGDMILGALIDAGLSPRLLREEMKKLDLPTVRIQIRKVMKSGLSGTQAIVRGKGEKRSHRRLKELLRIIDRSGITREIKEKSKEIFHRIASVEAKIHKRPPEDIHFHEIGGLDSIVDIVGAVWGIGHLGIQDVYVSPVNTGSGFVTCEHGRLPIPAPATLALMKGKPVYSSGVQRELLTPTGAAILTSFGREFGPMPPMKVESIGYGAGRDDLTHPNLLRLVVGNQARPGGKERVTVIETNIDDMNPQFYDYLIERLLAMEVHDVFLTPIQMKKNRPATLLTILCPPEILPSVSAFLFRETTTLGLRWREEERACADRETMTLQTRYGKIQFKLASWNGMRMNLSPEYENLKRIASTKRIPLKQVFEEAKKEAALFLNQKKGSR